MSSSSSSSSLLLLSSSLLLLLKVSHNESVMPEFWCESEKGKFLVPFNGGFLTSSTVCFQDSHELSSLAFK